jgi:hypothetical protein
LGCRAAHEADDIPRRELDPEDRPKLLDDERVQILIEVADMVPRSAIVDAVHPGTPDHQSVHISVLRNV